MIVRMHNNFSHFKFGREILKRCGVFGRFGAERHEKRVRLSLKETVASAEDDIGSDTGSVQWLCPVLGSAIDTVESARSSLSDPTTVPRATFAFD